MYNHYPFFKYVSGNSKIHVMSSKLKILLFLVLIINVIFIKDLISLLLMLVMIMFLIFASKINPNQYIKNAYEVWPLYIINFIISVAVSFSITVGIFTFVKSIFIILLFLILTFTTSLSEIAWGFEKLFEKLKKFKVPVAKIALSISMTIKFIANLSSRYKLIRKSMAYRGVAYHGNFITTFKKMTIPVISISLKETKRTVLSMRLRFYGYVKNRTNYNGFKETRFDKCLIFISLVLVYINISLGWIK